MTDIIQSIIALKADAQISVDANDVNQITWLDNNPTKITNEQILAKQVELQTAYDALDYQRKRKAEYPSIEELIVALYDTEDKLALENKRAAVKLKYPKENS